MSHQVGFDTEMKTLTENSDKDNTYELPDGNTISRWRGAPLQRPEVLFQPSTVGKEVAELATLPS